MEIRKIFGKEQYVEKVAICLFNTKTNKPELYHLNRNKYVNKRTSHI